MRCHPFSCIWKPSRNSAKHQGTKKKIAIIFLFVCVHRLCFSLCRRVGGCVDGHCIDVCGRALRACTSVPQLNASSVTQEAMSIRSHFKFKSTTRSTEVSYTRPLPQSVLAAAVDTMIAKCRSNCRQNDVCATIVALSSESASETRTGASVPSSNERVSVKRSRPRCSPTLMRECAECNGYVLVDEATGSHVCEACGLCQRSRVTHPSYDATATHVGNPNRQENGSCVPRSVAGWLRCDGRDTRMDQRIDSIREWLLLYQPYSGICNANVAAAMQTVANSTIAMRHNPEVVAIAISVVQTVCIPDADVVEQAMRENRPLPVMASCKPIAAFACKVCGRFSHDMKSAKYHCKRWGARSDRRG